MLTPREQNRHEELLSQCLEQYKGSPASFGALLFCSTETIDPFVMTKEMIANIRFVRVRARREILNLNGGPELIRLEEKSLC